MSEHPSERAIVFSVGAVQFVNILDFMIVMPLGPDFAKALGIPLSQLGWVGGSYTAAACLSGLAGVFFLDRFDRKKALGVAMVGLVLGTLSGALAQGLGTLMLARILAGAFGGPATSLSYSIIADAVPPERRGKAMGAVMGAFSVASVFGVPAGLELARLGGWRLPFLAVGGLGAALAVYTQIALPSMTAHLARARAKPPGVADLLSLLRLDVVISYSMTFVGMASGFVLVPNMSAYLLANLHYPREHLGLLYGVGGFVSFFAMRIVGWLVDRYGSMRVGTFGSIFIALVIYSGFVRFPPLITPMLIFIGYMGGSAFRNVSYNTLTTKVPLAEERARFTSVQSAVQHLASALGAFTGSLILVELPDKTLGGIPTVAWLSIGLGLLMPMFFWIVESRIAKRVVSV